MKEIVEDLIKSLAVLTAITAFSVILVFGVAYLFYLLLA